MESNAAKSPGYFQSELKRKVESAGGSFTKFSTQKTALSQTHLTGARKSKPACQSAVHDSVAAPVFLLSALRCVAASKVITPYADQQREPSSC